MKLLLDTHLLLWAAQFERGADRLPAEAQELIEDEANALHFSAASIWEVAIKKALARADFDVDPWALRRGLLDNGYSEIAVTSEHAAEVATLPLLHKDPFDRLLLAQARLEGTLLVTADAKLMRYEGPIRRV